MRSRYSAYVLGEIDYLVATQDPDTHASLDVDAIRAWSRDTEWHGLEIVDVDRGGPDDDVGVVEFIARGVTRGSAFAQHERSRFRRIDSRWYYVDGEIAVPSARRTSSVPGRNEPCPCGSGKKYKRCHG